MLKISIVIPTYNCAKYICEAINSVINQTYKNVEIIVVDDGSTDNTREILKPYIDSKKIRYFYEENSGPAKAKNKGIRIADGEYIAFLDSDDMWLPDKLKSQMDFFRSHPNIKAVHCDLDFFNADNILNNIFDKKRLIQEGWIFEDYLLLRSWVFLSCLLVRKTVLDTIGLFNESLYTAEDTNLILRIAKKYRFGFVDKILVKRRMHGKNLSQIGVENYGTFKNLDNIVELYPELHPSRSKLMRKAYEYRYASIGYSNFYKSDYTKARNFLLKALRMSYFNIKALMYLCSTFLPKTILNCLRGLRRFLLKYIKR